MDGPTVCLHEWEWEESGAQLSNCEASRECEVKGSTGG